MTCRKFTKPLAIEVWSELPEARAISIVTRQIAGVGQDRFRIPVHRLRWCVVVLTAALIGATPGELDEEALKAFAVHIDHTPKQSWPGYGIYLGNGLVITASHVVGEASLTKPKVVVDGQALPTRAVKEGSLATVDLTLLAVDTDNLPASLKGLRLALCEAPPKVGDEAFVAVPEGTTRTKIVSAEPLPWWLRLRFGTLIDDVPGTGNSGSGVFDARSGCLLGIISRRIAFRAAGQPGESSDKYFVPAAAIREFIPNDLP